MPPSIGFVSSRNHAASYRVAARVFPRFDAMLERSHPNWNRHVAGASRALDAPRRAEHDVNRIGACKPRREGPERRSAWRPIVAPCGVRALVVMGIDRRIVREHHRFGIADRAVPGSQRGFGRGVD